MVRFILAATIVVALTTVLDVSKASAVEPQRRAMTVTCSEMCGGCVKKIEKHFAGSKGIAGIKYDVATKTVAFEAAPGYYLCAAGIWTAMDKIGKTPVQLVEGNGTVHTKKPQE
jgi:copper chaperone CopZ